MDLVSRCLACVWGCLGLLIQSLICLYVKFYNGCGFVVCLLLIGGYFVGFGIWHGFCGVCLAFGICLTLRGVFV